MKITPVANQNYPHFEARKRLGIREKAQTLVQNITSKKEVQNPFETTQDTQVKSKKTAVDVKNQRLIEKNMTSEAKAIYQKGQQIALYSHSPEVENWHTYLALLMQTNEFLKGMADGSVKLENEARFLTPAFLQDSIYENCTAFQDDKTREKIIGIIDEHINYMNENFVKRDQQQYGVRKFGTPTLSKGAIDALSDAWEQAANAAQSDNFYDSYFIGAAVLSQDEKLRKETSKLILDMGAAVMSEDGTKNEKYHIQFYDNKADLIWQNIAHGNNVMVLNDQENSKSYRYLVNSFSNLINKPGQKYGNLKPENTEITVLNEKANFVFLDAFIRDLKFDKSKQGKTVVVMGNFDTLISRTGGQVPLTTLKLMENSAKKNPNGPDIKFVMSMSPESYHANTAQENAFKDVLTSYAQQSLPILNASEAREYLTNESGVRFIESQTQKKILPESVLKSIEITSSKNGNYPEKTIEFLSTVSKYFVNEDEIRPEHIDKYLEDTKHLSEASDNDERSIIFDTGKTLGDIKGMPMTKADAKTIARQIKNGTIGTRGYVIQHSHGSAYGGGRRHTAEAIAGEAQIPMITINAKDFALKDIDALSQQAGLSEIKIKKLISTAKAQAEANKLNTAMIYIENFDNFASNPLYGISSIYEQKAFTQLLSEMDSARKDGKVNLVVIGSMNMPETLDENVAKPYKFLNQVIVYQPQDADQRREILDYYIDKNGLRIAGDGKEREEILKNISESTQGFSVVDLMYMLDNALIISQERGKNAIDGTDFTESFLQTTTGRTNTAEISTPRKKIVTSHEAGHALALQLMYEIAEKQNIPWHLPQKVDFITLDPRGDYGGAMFFKDSENEEYSFERILSDIVTDYGGHSAENVIYNMQGSWGITADMEMAAHTAELAVMRMGMGAKTGVRHTKRDNLISEKQREVIASDMENLLKTGKKISDSIITEYKDFILEFTEKYHAKVATGECIIPRKEFITMLNEWREKQSPEKRAQLEQLEQNILKDIQNCKEGKV